MSNFSIDPSVDKGVTPGNSNFTGGTLCCHCATDPVAVTIKGNVAHNHACGCTKWWKPKGAAFSVAAVVPRENVSITVNGQKPKVVDASAAIRRPRLRELKLEPCDCLSPPLMDAISAHTAKARGIL